ncbi:glyoxalase [Flavobacterium sp.]|uniref:glyoxalase n=1 Tax=Flavobacterium sp. TaxID=239 RepID=UPI00286BC6EF|nr:glyoxalase [Flavobacterium sp.]
MNNQIKSIRPFIGAKNYELSRSFYCDLGFKENILSTGMSYFDMNGFGFYLQNAYVKDWVENTMVFMEVTNAEHFWTQLVKLELTSKYENVKLVPIRDMDWGNECFLHDPSGILWHFGEFKTK